MSNDSKIIFDLGSKSLEARARAERRFTRELLNLEARACELLTDDDPALATISQCKFYIGMEVTRGKVWTRTQLLNEFDIEAVDGQSVIVTRYSDGACGSVLRGRYPAEDGGHAIYTDFSE